MRRGDLVVIVDEVTKEILKEAEEREQYVNEFWKKVNRDSLLETIVRQDHEIEYLKECLEEVKKDEKYYESMYKAMRELVDRKGF